MFNPEFILTSLLVILVPGTGVIYTVSTGLFCGWRQSIAAAIGCTAGIIPHLMACILGLSAILHMSAVAFQFVKLAGAFYLFYLAWSMWRETGGIRLDSPSLKKGFYIQYCPQGFFIKYPQSKAFDLLPGISAPFYLTGRGVANTGDGTAQPRFYGYDFGCLYPVWHSSKQGKQITLLVHRSWSAGFNDHLQQHSQPLGSSWQ